MSPPPSVRTPGIIPGEIQLPCRWADSHETRLYKVPKMTHETSYTQARERLAALMDQVTDTREPVLIRRRGKEPVALIAADELAGWIETAYLMRSPENARRLMEAGRRADAGEGEAVDVDDLRERLGLSNT